jgi:hypothetical protein
LCTATWHVITIDQKQEEEELLHAGVKTVKSSNSNMNKHNTSTTTTAAVVSEPELEAKDTWPEISNRLCPKMKPKSQFEHTIFYLARQELIKDQEPHPSRLIRRMLHQLEDCNSMQDQLPLQFFPFTYGAFSRASDGSNSNGYLFPNVEVGQC